MAPTFLGYSTCLNVSSIVCDDSKTLSGVRLLSMILDLGIGNPAAAWIKSRYGHSLANVVAE